MKTAAPLTAVLALACTMHFAHAQSTASTYQGSLSDADGPANGLFDMSFGLFITDTGGTAVSTVTNISVSVSSGLFTTTLDFGSGVFDGRDYWLEIAVRPDGGSEFTTLSSRQPLHAVPYAIHAAMAMGLVNPVFLGTTTATPLEFYVNNERALRLESTATVGTVNVVAGSSLNMVGAGVVGATISGGGTVSSSEAAPNIVSGSFSTIGGGWANTSGGTSGTIGGGHFNTILAETGFATIGGGTGNSIRRLANQATISGGFENTIDDFAGGATISGGSRHTIQNTAPGATISGGYENTIQNNAFYATISGGSENIVKAFADGATIGGGQNNTNGAFLGTIGGGFLNTIQGTSLQALAATISGGHFNTILAEAELATIAGGQFNTAGGRFSFAAGRQAQALHEGSFVWSDSSSSNATPLASIPFPSVATNEFAVRATGGMRFVTGIDPNGTTTAGVQVSAGGTGWSSISDRNMKENYEPVDSRAVLEQVAAMPIQRWNMITQDPSIRHIGPMAQDFHAAFGVGEDNRHINSVDADGVALAAIQGLHQKVQEQAARIQALEQIVAQLARLLETE